MLRDTVCGTHTIQDVTVSISTAGGVTKMYATFSLQSFTEFSLAMFSEISAEKSLRSER